VVEVDTIVDASDLAHELKQTLLLMAFISWREEHVGELCREYFDVFFAVFGESLLGRHATYTDWGMRKDDRCDVGIVHLKIDPSIEEPLCEDASSSHCDGC